MKKVNGRGGGPAVIVSILHKSEKSFFREAVVFGSGGEALGFGTSNWGGSGGWDKVRNHSPKMKKDAAPTGRPLSTLPFYHGTTEKQVEKPLNIR